VPAGNHRAAAGQASTRPGSKGKPRQGTATRPGGRDASGTAIERGRDIRQVDPSKPGPHTSNGSPIETNIDIGKKPPAPSARPKDPTTP
jgi:hypothetical protein